VSTGATCFFSGDRCPLALSVQAQPGCKTTCKRVRGNATGRRILRLLGHLQLCRLRVTGYRVRKDVSTGERGCGLLRAGRLLRSWRRIGVEAPGGEGLGDDPNQCLGAAACSISPRADADTLNGHKPMQAPAQGRRSSKTQGVGGSSRRWVPAGNPGGLTFGTSIKVRGSSEPSLAATSPRSVGGPRLGGLLGAKTTSGRFGELRLRRPFDRPIHRRAADIQ